MLLYCVPVFKVYTTKFQLFQTLRSVKQREKKRQYLDIYIHIILLLIKFLKWMQKKNLISYLLAKIF